MTVSNVVNGRIGKMGEATRSAVEREIARLGYRPYTQARNLRRSEQLTIGMIILDEAPAFLTDPLNTTIVAGLSNYLSQRGYGLMLQGVHPERFSGAMLLRAIRTDGICAILSGSDDLRRHAAERLLDLGQPVVLFQETLRLRDPNLLVIRQDDRGGARLLAAAVLAKGARRLLMLVPDVVWPAMVERTRGVQEAMRVADSRANLRVVACRENDFDDIQQVLRRDIETAGRPDAVLAGNDQIGIAALRLLQDQGLNVPDDIMVTGFNALNFRRHTQPMLTTIRSPVYEMGVRGGQELLVKLEGGRFSGREVISEVEFVPGGSI
ncbi:MAG: hypothetical protein BGP12_09190 [Rhodospirillales bacterium 70-18]|nr:MAG: hypothetical protein BGP12_09190 [Rhodospirillales bacterium 70-18]